QDAAFTTNIDSGQRAGRGVEAGREHDDVECIVTIASTDPGARDSLDRSLAQVHELDVRLVVNLVVAILERYALRTERMNGHELRGDGRVAHTLANLPPDELARPAVHGLVRHEIHEVALPECEAGLRPKGLEHRLAFLRRHCETRARIEAVHEAAHGLATSREYGGIAAADLAPVLIGQRRVSLRHAIGRRTLEHDQPINLVRDRLDDLDTRGARADDADPLAGEIEAAVGPACRVVVLAPERLQPLDVGKLVSGQRPDGGDEVARSGALALAGLDEPRVIPRVIPRRGDFRLEANVAQQIEL